MNPMNNHDQKMREHEMTEAADHAIANAAGWPPRLVKALSDSYNYTVKISGESRPWNFESASVIDAHWVRLDGVEWPHEQLTRGVDVRVAAIEWITDAES